MLNAVMVVDDEASIRTAVEQWLSLSGFEVQLFSRAEECLAQLPRDFAGVILSDVRMPGLSGLELLAEVQRRDADLPVILLTGHGDVPMAVEAMRDGAYDFLEKPFSPDALLNSLRRALDKRGLVLENRRLHQQAGQRAQLESSLLGMSRALQNLRRQVLDLAALPVNVLIRGETGSGKELVARCLHDFGPRAKKPFVALNCAAIPEQLFEAELFGHESGAFTGAQGKRIGKLEYAHGGTLFLDEIESMPLAQQVKLLRVLQEQKLERLGSNQSIPVDLRIIAATKPDLLEEARAGRFREDLAYRLNVAQLRLPPLRERREDIPLLYEHFAQSAAERLGRHVEPLSGAQLGRLLSHDWPGNVRELANVAERQVLGLGEPEPDTVETGQSLAAQQEAFEAQCLKAALTRHKGDIKAVLAELQLPRRTFNEKMQRHGLTREMFLPDE
ncbi:MULTISPECIES: sigma-54-dependent transcriptional regulator [Pseudomonas]|jgi:two-component system, NtrC family, C4-dicarboxylate transport response regulator DctD|uniref:Sigma-54-dependent Fis family transcriptional regulator n=1 Tax=Pseudomonas rhodesiae TaxID=76760 RepID=A0A8I1JBR2_9PSED|nr:MULTISPECIES: sigma-54 dependent transcriptional regulator [Pseudomonas]MBB4812043.1 two-component system C4-dicarboxylate transport response regulator DctD [Pseudomonas rhodesiae]MBI6604237.1 sigma-54-dependent Fis family transcriptional regulator [Pseudomonas sp. S4_EA_1b]MBI6622970.1 sigma-54-dependent Fis family transcriptional regulator [Pseudomonas rhodesiae]NMY80271.1 sigma-54-dependent Fis family transcriptional regulator [Pseudomonas rhodesiae]QVN06227.1 sigma-54-dependent Fis fami